MASETVSRGEGVSGERERAAQWELRWVGTRHRAVNGVCRVEPVEATLRVFQPGNWIICGGDGCLIVREDDPALYAEIVRLVFGPLPPIPPGD